jgi:HD superfamily phosphohydrolase
MDNKEIFTRKLVRSTRSSFDQEQVLYPLEKKLVLRHKIIFDNIHKQIYLSNYAVKIIDNIWFQRLRYIGQLGMCSYIWPSANHTRFAHSIGTYLTCSVVLSAIRKNSNKKHLDYCISQIEDLKDSFNNESPSFNDWICELIKLAGLCHDLGHNAYSHSFDYLLDKNTDKEAKHEYRSGTILEKIIKEEKMNITQKEINFIKKLIDPDSTCSGFVFQIVSNNLNSIDSDKMDYIERDSNSIKQNFGFNWEILAKNIAVIDNTICYRQQFSNSIYAMFNARYQLHKQMYHHPKVLSIQFMYQDIIKLLDEKYEFSKAIYDDTFLKITDSRLTNLIEDLDPTKNKEEKKALEIYNRIIKRKLYKHVGTLIQRVDPDISDFKPNMLSIEDICILSDGKIRSDEIIIYETKLGYIGGNKKNPLCNVYLYSKKNSLTKLKLRVEDIAGLTLGACQEYNAFYFCKTIEKAYIIKNIITTYKEELEKKDSLGKL